MAKIKDTPDKRIEKGEKTKHRILEAAISLFSEKGFDGTSVKDITDAAGIPKSLFYHYFNSMDELLGNIINTNNLRISEEEKSKHLEMPISTAMMNVYIGRIFNMMCAHRESLKILLLEFLKNKNVFHQFMDQLTQMSSDFDLITPDELKKGYDSKELAVLRLYYRFLPMMILVLTEEQVAEYYNINPEKMRDLLINAMQGSPLGAKKLDTEGLE